MDTTLPGGIEPLYDMQIAAKIIPHPYNNLRAYLHNHPEFPRRYRFVSRFRRRVRLISASEILELRHRLIQVK